MAFLVNCFIRKNTPEIREHLERGGLSICQCCTFDEESFKNDDYLSLHLIYRLFLYCITLTVDANIHLK